MLLLCTFLHRILPRNKLFGREYMTWCDRNEVSEVDVVAGCFMLVRRESIEQVGALDARYFVYGEETDWCYRFKQAGWKILYTPEAEIIHLGGQTSCQQARKLQLQLAGSILIFIRSHRSMFVFIVACLLTALFFFLRVPFWFVRGVLYKSKRKRSFETAITYLIGGLYCLAGWKRLLMNKDAVTNRWAREEALGA